MSAEGDVHADDKPKDTKECDVHVRESLDKMERGMTFATVGHHNNINKLVFQLAKKTENMNQRSMKASGPSVAKISCVIYHGSFV